MAGTRSLHACVCSNDSATAKPLRCGLQASCSVVALVSGTVVAYPVGSKVATDVFFCYLGFSVSYLHSALTASHEQFGQLVGPLWLMFMLPGFMMMYVANQLVSLVFFLQSLSAMLAGFYLGYARPLLRLVLKRELCGEIQNEDVSHLQTTTSVFDVAFVVSSSLFLAVLGCGLLVFAPSTVLGYRAHVALFYTGQVAVE